MNDATGQDRLYRPTTVVVLGMHRSGTSMTGALLEALGVDMGDGFKQGARANPIGFFEDKDFLQLNRSILHAAGGDMYAPPPPEAILDQKERFQKEIQQLVRQKTSPCWGWKDPRTSLTLTLYVDYLPNLRIIVCRRDIDAIANSLQARRDMPFDRGVELANLYDEHIRRFFARYPEVSRFEAPYEEITRHPEPWIRKVADFLALHPTEEQQQEAYSLVLPKHTLRLLRARRLIEKGLRRPWEIPGYLLQRLRYRR